MNKLLAILFFSFLLPQLLPAQIMPAEGKKLNYRLVGFKFPVVPGAGNSKIEIATGKLMTEAAFKKNIVETLPVKKNRTIAVVPSFGAEYTWRYSYSVNGVATQSPFYHFSTIYIPEIDPAINRFRIMQPALKYEDAYVFLNGYRTLYDMDGRPVWHLPDISRLAYFHLITDDYVSDMKRTNYNTITFLFRGQAYEINYDGDILWKAPNNGKVSGDSMENYHHALTRLSNGHYMVLGSQYNWKFPSSRDSLIDTNAGKKGYRGVEFGTIIEYDNKGNIVWSWKSSKYFLEEDPNFIKPLRRYYKDTPIDFIHPDLQRLQQDVHENAFFFDEKDKVIYISFKNVSEIIKIKYPEGKVLTTYSPNQKSGGGETGVNLFCHQHSCRVSQDGFLYLFNNNLCDTAPAKIELFQEPVNERDTLKKVWEYQCTVEGDNNRKFTSGGNIIELPDRSMFVCMGSFYSKVFIVNREKKILWSAIPEQWVPADKKWHPYHQSRASIISRKQLEDLIWNSGIKE